VNPMRKNIDCLFIGHNDTSFEKYEANVRRMGEHSGAYRDLNKNFIWYEQKPYHLPAVFNLFHGPAGNGSGYAPLRLGETFSPAIAYLGTYLHRRGFTFDYVNSFDEEKERLARMLRENSVLTVAVTTTLYTSAFPVLEIVQWVRRCNREAKIIIGGPFIATQVRVLEPRELSFLFESIGADYYVNSSQGESALIGIIQALKQGRLPGEVDNIYFAGKGEYISTGGPWEQNKLAENPVDWDLFSGGVSGFADVRTAISCPFACAFCGFPEHAGTYQTIAVEAVEQELRQLAKIPGLKCVYFVDDTLNVPVKRFKAILKMMKKNRFPFAWQSNFRCQFCDEEMVALMKETGCQGVFLGLESGNNRVLMNMNKVATVEKYFRGIALLKEYGITTHGSFIIGFPGETPETVRDTKTLITESGLDFFRAQMWYCEKITPVWRKKEHYHIEGSQYEWSHSTMNSKTAADLVDEIFMNITDPVWVPQYNFEFYKVIHLLNHGVVMSGIKRFLSAFNKGVREKLTATGHREISLEIIKELSRSLVETGHSGNPPGIKRDLVKKYNADFGF
jgi:anaerobic magnesium-protoporphyrin IX monomethyl ester cyclase